MTAAASVTEAEAAPHTPGPWHHGNLSDGWAVLDAKNNLIANLGSDDPDYQISAVLQADARLIAAAPDLLDGCNALLGLLTLLANRDDVSPELRQHLTTGHRIDEARAAIAKAVQS